VNRTVVVLAGGRSSRFGRDKLAEPIDGRPVLDRTIAALGDLADEILVVTGPDSVIAVPEGVHVVRDRVAFKGPLVGLVTGLEAARHGTVVVVGADMPWLRTEVLALMLAAVRPDIGAVVLGSGGRRQQLPLVLGRDVSLEVARRLTDSGERRLGALLDALEVAVVAEETWRMIDPDAETLRDIDTPEDLATPG